MTRSRSRSATSTSPPAPSPAEPFAVTTLVKRGSGTPATGGLTAWTTLTNAVDGTPPANPATYAVWTNAASGGSGYIEISGYDFSAIADTDTLNSVTVSVRHLVSATARFASVAYQAWSRWRRRWARSAPAR